jgi:hypothetical protein
MFVRATACFGRAWADIWDLVGRLRRRPTARDTNTTHLRYPFIIKSSPDQMPQGNHAQESNV